MQEEAAKFTELLDFRGIDAENLPQVVKMHLQLSQKDWNASRYKNTKLHRLCNSLRFWKNKLKPAVKSNNIIVTLYNENRDVKPDMLNMVYTIEKVAPGVLVRGVSEFRNPKYLCFYFHSQEDKELVEQSLKHYDDSLVVFLSWALDEAVAVLKVHWLPWAVDVELIKKELEKYVVIVNEHRETLSLLNGRILPAGKLTYGVKMREGVTIEQVPHLTVIDEMDALITMQGRAPLCINCNLIGHVAKKCKSKYCFSCKKFALKTHECIAGGTLSYAEVAKGPAAVDPDLIVSDDEEGEGQSMAEVPTKSAFELGLEIELLQAQLKAHGGVLSTRAGAATKRKNQTSSLEAQLDNGVEDVQTILKPVVEVVNELNEAGASERLPPETEVVLGGGRNVQTTTKNHKISKQYGRSSGKSGLGGNKAAKLFDAAFANDFVFKD